MNLVIGGILLRWALGVVAGLISAHTGYQVTQDDVNALAIVAEGVIGAAAGALPIWLSIRNKKRLGAL